MNTEPTRAYVYQPLKPTPDGKFYGVGGLNNFWLGSEIKIEGITKSDAEQIAKMLNDAPLEAADIVDWVKYRIDNDFKSECGCTFESIFNSSILLCDECSKLPCHNRGASE